MQMYENVVFLFIVHPFDIGDLLQVDTECYRVAQIDLLYTIMHHTNGSMLWYPNQKLMAAPFTNITVSAEKWDSIRIVLDMDVAPAVMEAVKAAGEGVQAAMPTEVLAGSVGVSLRDAAAPLKYTLGMGWKYTHCGTL
jgi:small-conductance mechanosensitive channel